ncbi:MAG: Amylo-alpha,6-glucosidase [Acidobacteriales bacterium]|nr:Amylo-alpha,6-glucosidase [Terriglobales bacterium]
MSALPIVPESELVEIPCPHIEPRIAYQVSEPRKSNNLTLIDGKTFLSTSVAGDISPPGAPDVGFFHDDTRFLSNIELKVDGHRTVVLSSSTEKSYASQIELTTGNITLRDSFDLPENTIHIRRDQLVTKNVFFDHLVFENFNLKPIKFRVELIYGADFVDVFQVRGVARGSCGHFYSPVMKGDVLLFVYRGRDDIMRQTSIKFSPAPEQVDGTTVGWNVQLNPLERVRIETMVTALVQDDPYAHHKAPDFNSSMRSRRHAVALWESASTKIQSSNEAFDAVLNSASGDFHALQIPDGNQHVVAAGIPWFATIFGRDSIIAAYQALILNPQLADETLRVLARYQGNEVNDWRDEQPGKIIHEQRQGEMTRTGEMPFGAYYGSVDSTPLFLMLVSEAFNWTADEKLISDLLPNIHRALSWIDIYGDLDGDGFVEFQRRSPKGLANQGWKDSWDANMFPDGTIAQSPIALVEVQGYVYDAKYRLSKLLRSLGDTQTADRLKREAVELAKQIERSFWMQRQGFYAMGLDKDKKKIDVISSNPGHLLFTRAVKTDRARLVANRLMQPDMHSGWGWRTLSKDEKVFNPLSYHRGSVWPHDNSLIAHGMALYDFRKPALHTLTTLFQAAQTFRDSRLPELFCGIQRKDSDVPVHYPVSCSPQAWASGTMFFMLTSVLGIRPSAPQRELNIMNPTLPEWLDYLQIRNMRVGNSRVSLDFSRRGDRTFCNVVEVEGEKLLVNVAFKK